MNHTTILHLDIQSTFSERNGKQKGEKSGYADNYFMNDVVVEDYLYFLLCM